MTEDDRLYLLQRAEEERARAEASKQADVAKRHAVLAQLYELRAKDPAAWAKISTQKSP